MVETTKVLAAFVSILAMSSSLGCEPAAYQTTEPAYPSPSRAPPIPTRSNPAEVRFDLRAGDKSTGHVLTKSSGAYLSEINGEQRTVIGVSIEVNNASGARELVVDPADLSLVAVDTSTVGRLDGIASAGSSGRVAVAAKETATVRAHFTLPSGITPNDIRGYELQWALRDGDRLVQMKTPFVESGGGARVAYVAPSPLPSDDRSRPPPPTTTYYGTYAPYGYYYGGVFYDTHLYPYGVPHHNDITIVPHLDWGHHYGTYDYGGFHGGSHGGGSFHGGSLHGGGHHGGGHH